VTDDLLKLELRFLLLRYSRRRVLEGIAALSEQTLADIEGEIARLAESRAHKQRKPKPTQGLVAEACRGRPEVADIVLTLASRFEAKTLLTQLRDVERFLDRAGVKHGKLKSRRAAIPHVVAALAQMRPEELKALAAPEGSTGGSDFAILAREIIGGRSQQRPAHVPPGDTRKE
jgi:hypothetical protein